MGIYRLALELELKKAQDMFDKISAEAVDALDRLQASGEAALNEEDQTLIDKMMEASDKLDDVKRRIREHDYAA